MNNGSENPGKQFNRVLFGPSLQIQVACGGGSYMWGANSIYSMHQTGDTGSRHVSTATAGDGNGISRFRFVVNGVPVFARGASLVPFQVLEVNVNKSYIDSIVQSVHDGNMNMIRVRECPSVVVGAGCNDVRYLLFSLRKH